MDGHGIARSSRPRTEEQRQLQLEKIRRYRELEDQVRDKISTNHYDREVFDLTSKLLRLNPEYYTVWNARRRCIISGWSSRPLPGSSPSKASQISTAPGMHTHSSAESSQSSSTETPSAPGSQTIGRNGTIPDGPDQAAEKDTIASELMFTVPLLMEYPKCYWLWNYRLWVLQQAIDRLQTPVARRIWEEELGLVGKMLHRDRRNFHAWGYRRHVVRQLESPVLEGSSMVEPEYEYTTKMIRNDLSNFSAWHNRSQLIPRLLDGRKADDKARLELLEQELKLVQNGLNVGPEDQSLWYYHQYLVLSIINEQGLSFAPNISTEKKSELLQQEIVNIEDLLEDYTDLKWIYESLIEGSLALSQVEGRPPSAHEFERVEGWLAILRKLDLQRQGRWADFEKSLELFRHKPGSF